VQLLGLVVAMVSITHFIPVRNCHGRMVSFFTRCGSVLGHCRIVAKVTTNHISADAVLIWDRIGSVVLLPVLLLNIPLTHFATKDMLVGTLAGLTNSLGALYLYMSLQSGGESFHRRTFDALYPLVTALLAVVFLG